jgi:alcohol dehydrogenase class IV
MIDCLDSNHAAAAIAERAKSLGLSNDVNKLGINDLSDLNIIVKNRFNPGRVNNNPSRLSESDLHTMLNIILADH